MPFIKRSISPVDLCNKPVPDNHKFDLKIICNNSLVGAIKQLASLSFHAEELFSELSNECHDVYSRSSQMIKRINDLERRIDQLDFRTSAIPQGDLINSEKIEENFASSVNLEKNIFTPSTRPESVIESYDEASPSPALIIGQCDPYRNDGLSGSNLFALTPVVMKPFSDINCGNSNKQSQIGKSEQRCNRHEPVRHRSMVALTPVGRTLAEAERRSNVRQLSASQPNDLVPIDTSGSNFTRMRQYRETLRSVSHENMNSGAHSERRRQRRRQTVSGMPFHSQDQLNQGFYDAVSHQRHSRSLSRDRLDRPRSVAYLDRYAPKDERFFKSREELRRERLDREKSVERIEKRPLDRSCSLRRSMRSLFKAPDREKSQSMDLWADGRPRSPGPFMVDVGTHSRSRSLPRSLKSVKQSMSKFIKSRSSSTEGRLDEGRVSYNSKENMAAEEFVTHVVKPKSRGLLRSMTMRMSRSQSNVSSLSTRRPVNRRNHAADRSSSRPKSMEVKQSAAKSHRQAVLKEKGDVAGKTPSRSTHTSTAGNRQATVFGSVGNLSNRHRLNIPPGTYWRAFGEVNYRQTPRQKFAERQSSSGHWSGTDSMRFSSSSAGSAIPDTSSFSSHDRDSAISCTQAFPYMGRFPERQKSLTLSTISGTDASSVTGDDGSTILKSTPPSSGVKATSRAKTGADASEKRIKRRSRKDRKRSEQESTTTLTAKNIKMHSKTYRSCLTSGKVSDDDLSLYSVDQDGFYTSMHKDSGLEPRTYEKIAEAPEKFMKHQTNQASQKAIYKKDENSLRTKIPPAPPPRTSSYHDGTTNIGEDDMIKSSLSQSQNSLNSLNDQLDRIQTFSSTLSLSSIKSNISKTEKNTKSGSSRKSSETEIISSRIKTKTDISPAVYPTICPVTPQHSDDNDSDAKGASAVPVQNIAENKRHSANIDRRKSDKAIPVPHKGLKKSMLPHDIKVNGANSAFGKGVRQSSFRMMINAMLESSYEKSDRSLDDSVISLEFDLAGMELIDTSIYSTWPRRPRPISEARCDIAFRDNNENAVSPASENKSRGTGTGDRSKAPCIPNSFAPDVSLTANGHNAFSQTIQQNLKPLLASNEDKSFLKKKNGRKTKNNLVLHELSIAPQSNVEKQDAFLVTESPKNGVMQKTIETSNKTPEVSPADANDEGEKTSTWPKKKTSKEMEVTAYDESPEICTRGYTDPEDSKSWSSTFPRRKDKNSANHHITDSPKGSQQLTEQREVLSSESQFQTTVFSDKSHKRRATVSSGTREKTTSPLKGKGQEPSKRSVPKQKVPVSVQTTPSDAVPGHSQAQTPAYASGPRPAQAQLIISSPVSSQAAYVDNPHKRSLCSPVSERDFHFFSENLGSPGSYGTTSCTLISDNVRSSPLSSGKVTCNSQDIHSSAMLYFGLTSETKELSRHALTPDSKPISEPLFPSISAMKHSITFPYIVKSKPGHENSNNNDSNRTWYDGIQEKELNEKLQSKTQSEIMKDDLLCSRGYPFSDFLDEDYLCKLETTRGKRWSGFSLKSHSSATSSINEHQHTHVDGKRTKPSPSTDTSVGQASDNISLTSVFSSNSYNSVTKNASAECVPQSSKERRLSDKNLLRLNLKNNIAHMKNSPLSPGARKEKRSLELHKEPLVDGTARSIQSTSMRLSLMSPSKLKRSSAVLDDDLNVFTNNIPSTDSETSQSFSSDSPMAKTEFLLDIFASNSKRLCTSTSNFPARNMATLSKTTLSRRRSIRRTLSKGKLNRSRSTLDESSDSIQSYISTPNKSFSFDVSDISFSNAILDNSPTKAFLDDSSKKFSHPVTLSTKDCSVIQTSDRDRDLKRTCPQFSHQAAKVDFGQNSENKNKSIKKNERMVKDDNDDKNATNENTDKSSVTSKGVNINRNSNVSLKAVLNESVKSRRFQAPNKVSALCARSDNAQENSGLSCVQIAAKPGIKSSKDRVSRKLGTKNESPRNKREKCVSNSKTVVDDKEKRLTSKTHDMVEMNTKRISENIKGEKQKISNVEKAIGDTDLITKISSSDLEIVPDKKNETTPLELSCSKSDIQNIRKKTKEPSSLERLKIKSEAKEKSRTYRESQTVEKKNPKKGSTSYERKKHKKSKSSMLKSASTNDLKISDALIVASNVTYSSTAQLKTDQNLTTIELESSMTKSLSNLSCLSLLNDSSSVVYSSDVSIAKSVENMSLTSIADRKSDAKLTQKDGSQKSILHERFSRCALIKDSSQVSMSSSQEESPLEQTQEQQEHDLNPSRLVNGRVETCI